MQKQMKLFIHLLIYKNWAQVWLGPQNQYEPHGTYYGVQLDRNTRYHVCLNTDKTNFTKLVRSAI